MQAHERVKPEFNFGINKYDLPHRLREKYHDCGNYSAMNLVKYSGPPMCGNCNKVVPWFFFKCVKCEKHFIQDFRHPKFCNFYPTCWEHTLTLEWRYCSTHRADPDVYEWFAQIIEPIGLNPKEFSDEELAGIFDFD